MAKLIMPDPPGLAIDAPSQALMSNPEEAEGEERAANIIMAASNGAQTGVKLAVAVGAMVLAFVALIALANGLIGWLAGLFGLHDITFQGLIGYLFAPVFWLIGARDWSEAMRVGGLFGTKLVLNEFVAFIDLGGMKDLSARATAVAIFTLCGFANFSSIAIQMAVTGGLAPSQRPTIARLGLKALAAGSLSNLMSGALAGLFIGS
jgi:CNT family concentrative nucleoside transporter